MSAISSRSVLESCKQQPPPYLSKIGPTAIISGYATILNITTTALTFENSYPIPFTPSKSVLEGLGAIHKYSTCIEFYSLDFQDYDGKLVDSASPQELWRT
ncbi:uncharacterized protein EAF01_002365 [Botrytis porri]|uniref:uncharacterized protein n=1 Tax=Botrytis porri TaxID=87229 RepID=UPI0019013152|nr:uncharacterized protein EAF01_002365 [Botrytis porri]KAF7910856.1 hypothetical protein EAF01_002365 [Botrytis porri]